MVQFQFFYQNLSADDFFLFILYSTATFVKFQADVERSKMPLFCRLAGITRFNKLQRISTKLTGDDSGRFLLLNFLAGPILLSSGEQYFSMFALAVVLVPGALLEMIRFLLHLTFTFCCWPTVFWRAFARSIQLME